MGNNGEKIEGRGGREFQERDGGREGERNLYDELLTKLIKTSKKGELTAREKRKSYD